MGSTAASVRADARQAMNDAIADAAKRQLAEVGAPGLSVRAVAREVGMASSAIYRYVKSRDELLTMLIVNGYNELGEAVEAADRAVADRKDLGARFRSICRAIRRWANENPHLYALLYGSPVPGYVAPALTVGPATRVTLALAALLVESPQAVREVTSSTGGSGLEVDALAMYLPGVSEEAARRGVVVWVEIFGLVSFELFGHLVGSVADAEQFFERSLDDMAERIGLLG